MGRRTRLTEHYVRFYPKVSGFFGRRVDPSLAAELTQETFLRVSRGIGTFRGDTSLEGWVMAIAVNVLRSHFRSQSAGKRDGTKVEFELSDAETAATGSGLEAPPSALENLLGRERAERVREAIDALPPRQRQAILLTYFQEMSLDQAAMILQISRNTIKTHLREGREKLRHSLSHEVDFEDPS